MPACSGSDLRDAHFVGIGMDVDDPTLAAHLQPLGRSALEHRMAAELRDHRLDRLQRAERLAAADAGERVDLVQNPRRLARLQAILQQEAWLEDDRLLGTRARTQA